MRCDLRCDGYHCGELKDTVREAFGVDTAELWLTAQGGVGQHSQRLLGCESEPRSQNEGGRSGSSTWAPHPISHGRLDVKVWSSSKKQYGMNIHDAKLLAESYYGSFEERRHNGVIEAETLAHVVSSEEQREQIASKPEPPTQMGMHLDSTLTLQTKRRYISRMPTDPESLRNTE